jgi:hypothetical protein
MKASCIINSEGRVVDTSSMPNVFKVRNLQRRIAELNELADKFAANLGKQNLLVCKDSFFIKFQPCYTEDYLYLRYKVPIEANNPMVRQAYQLKTKGFLPPQGENRYNTDILYSIDCDTIRERVVWYVQYIQPFLLNRNLYDCQWQEFTPQAPVLYFRFLSAAQQGMITPEQLKKGTGNRAYYYPQEDLFQDEKLDMKTALYLISEKPQVKVDDRIYKAYQETYQQFGFQNKCEYSNQALYCLYAINDLRFSGKIYPLYLELREYIQKTLPDAFKIRYANNDILFVYNKRDYSIYVRDTINNQGECTLILNGNIFSDVSSLKESFVKAIKPCKWFETVVMPNIITNHRKENQYDGECNCTDNKRHDTIKWGGRRD